MPSGRNWASRRGVKRVSEHWTDEQREAILGRGGSLLVAASAGAGKTMVLVERIISRITDPVRPVDVDRLLVVTFTNAAAAEMRERISRALAKEIARQPGSAHLQRQLALLGRATICTMHSFCLDLLRQFFYRIDLDPAFRVADETEAALIQSEALEELFERRHAGPDSQLFAALADSYGGKRDDGDLQDLVLEAYRFARSTPRPEEWLARLPESFDLPAGASFDELPWGAALKEALAMDLAAALSSLELAVGLARRPGGPGVYLDNLEVEREAVLRLSRACAAGAPWAELHDLFNMLRFAKLKACKKEDADPGLTGQVKKLRDAAKKKIHGLSTGFFSRTPVELCADLRKVAPLIRELAGLVLEFGEVYRKSKAARGVVDFNDLEHFSLRVLEEQGPDGPVPSRAALELRERFEEVLVDEYQDINAVQEAILQLVSRQGGPEPNLFMVGDVKQSIYRFRLAEPGLFLAKYLRFPSSGGGPERRLNLTRNFRCRRGIVDAVNFLFRQIMTPVVGEMAYDEGAELVYGAGYPPGPGETAENDPAVELHLVERDDPWGEAGMNAGPSGEEAEDSAGVLEEELNAVQKEARLIAGRIRELVEGSPGQPGLKVYDKELQAYRPLLYRDMVVLMRATAGYANTFMEEFRQWGIPAYAELATGYFEATEVETILSLLRVIDNPRQDVPLAGVLRSPMVGLKAGDLAKVRLALPRGDFYDAVVAAALSDQGELGRRLTDFLERLEGWRTLARQGTLADLIWAVYRDTGFYDFTGGLPGGAQRQANLRALHHRAQQYEATTFRGLFLFLRFIERIREGGRDLGAARALSERENVVRIMSIHKSKGLEFPVVFLAGLGNRFNFRDLQKTMLFHKDLGLGPQLVDAAARVTYPTVVKVALKHRLRMEALAEEMRILYVALTRAREKLVLVGSARNLPNCLRRWCGPVSAAGWALPDGDLAGAATCLDWLVPALSRHRDGGALREGGLCEGGAPEEVLNHSSRWRLFFAGVPGPADPGGQSPGEIMERVRRVEPLAGEGPRAGAVRARLEWTYPRAELPGRPAKASVSEIKRRFDALEAEEDSPRDFRSPVGGRPLFLMEERGLTAAEAGTALHLVMQHLDLGLPLDVPGIKSQVEGMVIKELLTPEQARAVPVEKIVAFLAGPLGRRLLAGRQVLREIPFTLALPAEELYPEIGPGSGESVIVQGVVDCLVDEEDGLLLLDYKTDRLAPEQLDQAAARYRGQLNLYARAVEKILGRRVKEKYLYLFSLDLELKC